LILYNQQQHQPEDGRKTGSGAARDILLGDMALDLADGNRLQRDQWLGRAKSHFRDARDVGQVWLDSPKRRWITEGRYQIVAAAAIRHADVARWELALSDKPIEVDYPALIQSYVNVYRYLNFRMGGVEETMAEVLPLIAATRQGAGVGRHALSREDEHFTKHRDPGWLAEDCIPLLSRNPRWDCSLSKYTDPKEFLKPSRRIQLKPVFRGGHGTSATSYLNAGVLPVSTTRMGWSSPRAVIASCAIEQGIDTAAIMEGIDSRLLMSPDQLDDNFGMALEYMLDTSIEEAAAAINL